MTGRDLIVYILKNELEDEMLIKDGIFLGMRTEKDIAVMFDVGIATVKAWYKEGILPGIKIGDTIFFSVED